MTPEFLEYELRRLEGVVAVSVDESAVTLLVDPSVDGDALRVVVAGMLATAGVDLRVVVLGGTGGPALAPVRLAPVAIGTAAGIGVLAAAVAAAALTGVLHLGAPSTSSHQAAVRPPAAATPLTTVPRFGPSTTMLPGAPLLGGGGGAPAGPVAPADAGATGTAGSTGSAGSAGAPDAATGEGLGAAEPPALGSTVGPVAPHLPPGPASPTPPPPQIPPPPLPGATPTPPPTTDYTVAAPAVAPAALSPVLPVDDGTQLSA